MNRSVRKRKAEETLSIVESGGYRASDGEFVSIGGAVRAAVAGTRVWKPEELAELVQSERRALSLPTRIDVTNETSLAAARRMVEQHASPVLCLNFASAKNAGGGFLQGSQAQEESLARSSALFETQMAASLYYERNRACGSTLYTDHMIMSPGVPVFRDDDGALLDQPYEAAFLTAPAVNAGAVQRNQPQDVDAIVPTMRRRIAMVLALADREGFRNLVLGAWGCGVFRNDPAVIAGLFAETLGGSGAFAGCFEHVVFAVLDRPGGSTIGAFQKAFS